MKGKITHKDYLEFLKTIKLDDYRQKYLKYKSVEENLPKQIQILDFIYKYYWDDRKFLSFEEFIEVVITAKKEDLKDYNKQRNGYDEFSESAFPLFMKGWIARQYRTWVSILTQIQLGYLYEELFPNDQVIMSEELDRKKVDVRVLGKKDYGVKKVSSRKDVNINPEEKEGVIPITYHVPNINDLRNPFLKNGNYRKPYIDFIEDGRLDFLNNGFFVFNKKVFANVK